MMRFTLKELLKIKNGKDHKNLSDGKIPVFGSGGLMRYVDEYLYDKESILLPRKGSLNNIQYVNTPFWTVDTLYYTIVDTKKANAYYLYNLIKLFDLSKLNSGTGVPSMTFDAYYDIEVELPNLSTQNKIANVLSALDSKIELNNRINAELEAMAKIVYDYWFVQFDFPNAEGKPYKSSGGKMILCEELKREIPVGWNSGELQEIANIKMGQSPPGDTYNSEGDGMIFYQGCTDFGNRFPTVRQYTTQPTRFAKEGDILLSVRAPVGTLNIAKEDCCIGRGLAALNSKDNCIAYLFGVMVNLKQVFDRRNTDGTTFGSITKDDLFKLNVVRPNKDILKQYHNLISPAFEKQNQIANENIQLSSLRDWLLPMLMNEQVKVSSATLNMGVEEWSGLMVAEEREGYANNIQVTQPETKKFSLGNRTILSAYLLKQFNCKGFGRVMLMKLLYLVEHLCELDFESKYKVNVAGPYDELIREIELKLRTYRLYNAEQNKYDNHVSYHELGAVASIEELFNENFSNEAKTINSVLDKFKSSKWDQCEIVATMYAVWNNRIISQKPINDMALKQDFLNWDPQKRKYKDRLDAALYWMRMKEIVPSGWGKLIEK